jgi:hypothetical protein
MGSQFAHVDAILLRVHLEGGRAGAGAGGGGGEVSVLIDVDSIYFRIHRREG